MDDPKGSSNMKWEEKMQEFFNNIISGIGFNDILDILVVAFVFYKILGFIKRSRAEQLVKGLIIVILAAGLSELLDLYTLNWILKGSLAVGVIALVVVFQPELRRGLESLGRSKLLKSSFSQVDQDKAQLQIREFKAALRELSDSRTGALIIIERQVSLSDICETGIRVDGVITKELIGNLFYEGAPLHDGAIVIRGDRIHSGGCVLPLTQNKSLPSELGTRHRAGIGITEVSDAISLIVSEETGVISCAIDGKLNRYLDDKELERILQNCYSNNKPKGILNNVKSAFDRWGGNDDV